MAKKKKTPNRSYPPLSAAPAVSYRFKILQSQTPLRQYRLLPSSTSPVRWISDWLGRRKI